MFGLLNPFILWLAPLLAGPLIIHFMGRAEPRPRDFPSLLSVRGQLMRAMQRHRLKNWLQLLLRTLLLLCLLFAAAGPVWRSGSRWTPPEAAALLIHNGAYAAIPDEESAGGDLAGAQERLRRGLDSLAPGRVTVEPVIADAPRGAARFGRYGEAVARLLQKTGSASEAPATHIYLPVFDPRDLEGLASMLKPWLSEHPRGRVALIDYGRARDRLNPFGEPEALAGKEGQAALSVPISKEAAAPLWMPENGAARETRVEGGRAEIVLSLPESGEIRGAFVRNAADRNNFAESLAAVSLRIPPPATLCLFSPSRSWMERASLGETGPRLRILSLASAAELGNATCDLLYLADPENVSPTALSRAAALLRAGGKVIIGTGHNTDAALLNRNLLAPLGLGRLTTVATHGSLAAHPETAALSRLGLRTQAWGAPGAVRAHFGFLPAAGTSVLLSLKTGDATAPLLLHRKAGPGEILLWTTDIGDPEWSDVGLNPWAALMHQAFFAGPSGNAWATGLQLRRVDSDSGIFLAVPEGREARLLGPDGSVSTRWSPEPGGGRAGPFDQTGVYRLVYGPDTTGFAVGLASKSRAIRETGDDRDFWKALDAELGQASSRVRRVDEPTAWRGLYGGFSLRFALLILAALLLFAEGVASLRLSPFRN